jgi:hypothetical protein
MVKSRVEVQSVLCVGENGRRCGVLRQLFPASQGFFLRAGTARWFVLLGISEYEISCLRNSEMTRITVPNCDGVAVCVVAVSIDKRWKDCGSIMRGLGGEEDGFWTTGGLMGMLRTLGELL